MPEAVATGSTKPSADMRDKVVQIAGTFIATLAIDGTIDGSNWNEVVAGITSPQIVDVTRWYSALRIRTTAYTSGTATAWLGGINVLRS